MILQDEIVNQHLRLKDIDFKQWNGRHPGTFGTFLEYLVSIPGYMLLLLILLSFDVFVLIFLVPGIGIGDRYFKTNMILDGAVPGGAVRITLIAALLVTIILKIGYNFFLRSIFALSGVTVGTSMSNQHVNRMLSLGSYTKWRYFKYLNAMCSSDEQMIGRLIHIADEWKRFLTIKALVFSIACIQLTFYFRAPKYLGNIYISRVFLAYWLVKIVLFGVEAGAKLFGLIIYLFRFRKEVALKPGMSLTDFYEMRVGTHAVNLLPNSETRRRFSPQARVQDVDEIEVDDFQIEKPVPAPPRPSYASRVQQQSSYRQPWVESMSQMPGDLSTPPAKSDVNSQMISEYQGDGDDFSPVRYTYNEKHERLDEEDEQDQPWMRYTLMTNKTNPDGL